jgi:enoyl-CoA hydratase
MDFDRYHALRFARRGRILTIRIARPEAMNAVNEQLHEELAQVFTDANRDPDSDVIVLTGEGKAFCAGGDAQWLTRIAESPENFEAIASDGKRIVYSLLEVDKPVICRLNGAAAGLGATIALMSDIIVAAESARIGDPHVKMGLVAGDGGAVIWPQLVGFARAKEYLLTGRMIKAAEAERIGLINHVVPDDRLDEKVDALADELVGGATQAIRWTKVVTNMPLRKLAHELMDPSIAYEMASNRTADHHEAVRAFVEKRPPRFTGR